MLISLISLVMFIPMITRTGISDQNYTVCAPQSCGNITTVKYPFWIPEKQESFCGHPSCNISCKNDEIAVIKLSNEDYIVTRINYNDQTFHLVNAVVYEDNITCPTPLHNITLEHTPFKFSTNYADFFLFYHCLNPPTQLSVYFPINCAEARKSRSSKLAYKSFGDFHTGELADLNYSSRLCESVVGVPVDVDVRQSDSAADYFLKMNYKQVLRQGITLNWTVHDCSECETSGGHCGLQGNEFICFCKNKTYSRTCHDDKKKTPKEIVLIGVGIAAAACSVMFISMLCFFYRRRYKQNGPPAGKVPHKRVSGTFSTTLDLNASTYFGVQVFSYSELEAATEYFNPAKELGAGGFGTVYHGILQDGREVAIKRLYENNNKRAEQFLNEVEILANLRHKNLVNLFGCTSRQSRELLLVYEYVPNGTVAENLHGKNANLRLLSWPIRMAIATETASALVYLHASDIIHRDVKTQNILLDKDFSVKVADFGLSRLFPLDVTHVSTAPQGTPGYVDPEYYQCYQLTEKSDVYSFGVVLAELISAKPAVDVTRRRTEINLSSMLITKIQNDALDEFIDQSLSLGHPFDFKVKKEITAVSELAFQCLQGTRDMRPSMEQVLERLYEIQDHENKVDRAEIVDIPSDDVFMLKGDYSPSSPPEDNNKRRHILHASA